MTEILRSADCGNSPKNAFLEALAVAMASGDVEAALGRVADDVEWRMAGGDVARGKEQFAAALHGAQEKPARLTMVHALSHGKAGAVNGVVEYAGGRAHGFCHVFEFGSAKGTSVSRITSYVGQQ